MNTRQTDAYLRTPLGVVVRAWREARGWTITELATRAGRPITKGYVSQLEQNKIHQPSDEKLSQLAHALGISVLDLVTRRLPTTAADHEGGAVPTPSDQDHAVATRRTGFAFGSPLRAGQRRGRSDEDEQLQQLLARVDELRSMIEQIITERHHGDE